MKAIIKNGCDIILGENVRLSSVSKDWTFIRVKKGSFSDLKLVLGAADGLFALDDQGDEWRLMIETKNVAWEA